MASACDTCPVPGHCCRSIVLGSFGVLLDSPVDAQAEIDRCNRDNAASDAIPGGPIPFHPLFKRQDGTWVWWCPNLSETTGRCLDYENRPYACIHYQPGMDRLCVLHEPRTKAP